MRDVNLLDENLVLWNRFLDGDQDAFADLMRLHYKDLYNFATRFTPDEALIKDCLQELFLTLWKNRTTINETSFVKFYLLRSLRRKLFRHLSRQKKSIGYTEFQFETLFRSSPSVENKIVREESRLELSLRVKKLLSNLSKRQQEIIYLRFYMDADIEEIAEIMSLNRQSVYNLFHDALKKLKKLTTEKKLSMADFKHLTSLLSLHFAIV
jgi:RNA polymerase sigma factor (sigma-70 family)